MITIFWLSSRTADESSKQSGAILEWLFRLLGENIFSDFIVRKLAHFLEFTGLCFLFNLSFFQTYKRKMPVASVIATSLYAITDEIHQIFVEGRSCQVRDWAIDTAGAVCGTIGFFVLFVIVSYISERKNTIDRTAN